MKIAEALDKTIYKLNKAVDSPELDAQILLAYVLQTDRYKLITDSNRDISAIKIMKLNALARRRIRGEPIAYITGKKEFYSLNFIVTKEVLIPRPETEQIVDLALPLAKKNSSVLDLGAGSGAIAVAVKKNRPDLTVHACDISARALKIAKRNAQNILGNDSVIFSKSDLFSAYRNVRFDLILCNPPYLCSADKKKLQKEILFEPEFALFAGNQGREMIEQIISEAHEHLNRNGFLIMEFGFGQDDYLQIISRGNYLIKIYMDFSNVPRIAVLQKNE